MAHDGGAECKAILEVGLLTDEELRIACELAAEAGADWVKTSTGREKDRVTPTGKPDAEVRTTTCEVEGGGHGELLDSDGGAWLFAGRS